MIITKIRRQTIAEEQTVLSADCFVCGCRVELLDFAAALGILEIENPMLEEFISDGRIHAIETLSGKRWICKPSLFQKDKTQISKSKISEQNIIF